MTTWVLLTGLPGAGKSTLAKALKERWGERHSIAILDKDRIRESVFSAEFTDYSAAQDDLCGRVMIEAARYLTSSHTVEFIIFDGRTYSRHHQREEVFAAAENSGAQWRIVSVACPPEVAESRMASTDPKHPARNRGVELYRRLSHEFEPVYREHLEIDSTSSVEAAADLLWRYLSGGPL